MDNLIFSINAVAPIFIIILFGILLQRKGIINDNFNSIASDIVFKIALPALIFKDISSTDFRQLIDIKLILFSMAGILLLCGVLFALG